MKQLELLLIDDEPLVGQRLKGGLEKLGCAVEICKDPVLALDRIRQKAFDVVITDIMMPEVNGMQVLAAVKATSADTRVIIITGYASVDMAREIMEKGAFDMIAKPFKPSDLRQLVIKAAGDLGFDHIREQ